MSSQYKTLNISKPSEKQIMLLRDTHKYVCFGGARGGGKSWSVRSKAKILAFAYSGIKQMIIRKTYPELTANHITPLIEELRCYHPDGSQRFAKYNDSKKMITFPNGSTILFRYCDNDKDINRFQGTECDVMYIDEATHFSEDIFDKLKACVRGVNEFPKRIYLTCNPGGVGHQWVKRLFIDRIYNGNEMPNEYSFIQSFVTDNKALMQSDPSYLRNLQSLPHKLRLAWLEGNWEVFSGQFFEEWRNKPEHYEDRRYTHVIKQFAIPSGWKIFRSFDWGYSRPFSVGWWALDYDNCLYRIKEWYGCSGDANEGLKMDANRVFQTIHEIETTDPVLKGRTITGVADPAIWAKDGGYSINDYANQNHIYFTKGDHQRIPGWLQCHYRLAFDDNGFPMVYIFENCKDFIRTIPLQMYDEHKVEDLNSDLEDHAMDEFRYMCMLRTIAPRQNVEPKPKADDPLNLIK